MSTSGITIRTIFMAALVTVTLILMTGCQSEPEPTTTSDPGMTLEDILALTGENLAGLTTARFEMIDELESGTKFFGTTLKSVAGEVQAPDRTKMVVQVASPAMGFAEIDIVAVGDSAFMRFSSGAPWNPIPPEQVPFKFAGMGVILSDLIPEIDNPAITGREPIGDVQTVRIEGDLISEDLSTLVTSADPGYAIKLTIWVDEADHVLRQIRIAGQIFDDDGPDTSRLIILSDYGDAIDIQLPDTAS